MPSFSCDGCGDVFTKPKVQAHRRSCKSSYAISCLDCRTTFKGDEYSSHNSCISEAQKYQGKLYKPKQKGQPPKSPAANGSTQAEATTTPTKDAENGQKKRKEVEEQPAEVSDTTTKKAKTETKPKEEVPPADKITTLNYAIDLPWKKTVKRMFKKSGKTEMSVEEFKEALVAKLMDRIKADLTNTVSEKMAAIPYISMEDETVKY